MASRPRRAAAPDFKQLLDRHAEPGSGDDVVPDSGSETEDKIELDPEEDSVSDSDEEVIQSERMNQSSDQCYFGRNKCEWRKQAPENRGRRARENVLRQREGATNTAGNVNVIVDSFTLFFTEEMLDLILRCTNEYADHYLENGGWMTDRWSPIDKIELRAFMSCLIFAGVSKSKNESLEQMWSSHFGRPFLRAVMSFQRFTMIMKFLRFDNKQDRQQRKGRDKMTHVRELWELFIQRCRTCYNPSDNCTIDEQLVGFRGRCPFRVYMPQKPDKYGIKIWWICDSKNGYAYNGQIYLGREGNLPEVGLAHRVVEDLCRPLEYSGRNLTMDNFFTSIPLARNLLTKGLTLLGTLKANKPEIPPEFQKNRQREVHSSLHGFNNKMTLCSYVPKKGRSVILLSTMHNEVRISERDRKPNIILDYNATKGAVDTLDQCVHAYSSSRGTNRWPNKILFNILDIAAFNGAIIFFQNHPDWKSQKLSKRRLYLLELSKELAYEHMDRRAQMMNLPATLRGLLNDQGFTNCQISAHVEAAASDPERTRGRCHLCDTRTLVRVRCSQCMMFTCRNHSSKVIRCHKCLEQQ